MDELKVQLSAQQAAAADAAAALAAKEGELQQLKASNGTELAAWQAKLEELKQVCVCAPACVMCGC